MLLLLVAAAAVSLPGAIAARQRSHVFSAAEFATSLSARQRAEWSDSRLSSGFGRASILSEATERVYAALLRHRDCSLLAQALPGVALPDTGVPFDVGRPLTLNIGDLTLTIEAGYDSTAVDTTVLGVGHLHMGAPSSEIWALRDPDDPLAGAVRVTASEARRMAGEGWTIVRERHQFASFTISLHKPLFDRGRLDMPRTDECAHTRTDATAFVVLAALYDVENELRAREHAKPGAGDVAHEDRWQFAAEILSRP